MAVLSGWKEISSHLHLTVRTAQRWEKLGLPVHRVRESHRSPVVASVSELESWIRRKGNGKRPHNDARYSAGAHGLEKLRSDYLTQYRRTIELLRTMRQLSDERQKLIALIRANLTS